MKRNLNFQLVSLTGALLSQNEASPTGEPAKDINGADIPDGRGGFLVKQVVVPLIAAALVSTALLYVFPDDASGADEKTTRYKLAKRVQDAFTAKGDVELSVEEIVAIKVVVGKLWAPLVVGQIVEVLEG